MSVQEPRSHVLRNGLIFGAILALLGVGNTLIQVAAGAYHVDETTINRSVAVNVTDAGPTAPLGGVLFLAMLALTFVAGLLTARGAGKAGSGVRAGIVTGIFGSLIGGIANTIILVAFVAPGLQPPSDVSMSFDQIQTLFMVVTIGTQVLGLILGAGLGAVMGALGGMIGAKTSPNRKIIGLPPLPQAPTSYDPGYPGHPGYSGTPAQPGPTPQP